jgi:hypothetical protein
MAQITIEELMEIAFAVEDGDPIDWGVFSKGQEETMKMIASSIIEQFDKDSYTQQDIVVMLATITKLVTENMILHTKLMGTGNNEV